MSIMEIEGFSHQKPQEVPLEAIQNKLGDCQRCQLCQGRTKIVFGSGNPHARVMFIGEAPGKNEDLQGEPFVGAAGQNLSELLELAHLTRDEIYIANVLKCRPPSNRDPKPEEIQACSPFLREQVRSVWPDVIVCLGNFATRFILQTTQGITKLRGKFYQQGHFHVLPTYHPAAVIYRREWRATLDDDFRLLGTWLEEHPQASKDA